MSIAEVIFRLELVLGAILAAACFIAAALT